MGVGQKIKYLRKKAQFTQADLAEGIISVPYLSLIENEKVETPNELIRLFSEKLNVNITYLLNSEQSEARVINEYRQISKELQHYLTQNNLIKAKQICDRLILDKRNDSYSWKIEIHINLLLAKFFIATRDCQTTKKIIKEIKQTYKSIEHEEELSFELNYIQGSYSFMKKHYIHALSYFMNASNFISSVDEIRKGQLFYNISLVNSIHSYSAKSLYYGNKSLEIFSKEPHLIPTLNVLLIMGINYRKIGESEEAKRNFKKVLNLSIGDDNLKGYRAKALHNLGRCELRNNVDIALDYFIEALKIKQSFVAQDLEDMATTLEQIANCYYLRGGPHPLAIQYIAKVKELLKTNTHTIQFGSCKMLEGKIQKEIGNITIAIECFYYALDVFKYAKDFNHMADASEELANIFHAQRDYETTTKLLFKANKYRRLIRD